MAVLPELIFCMFFYSTFQPVPISSAEVWSRAFPNGLTLFKCYSWGFATRLFRHSNYLNFRKADFSRCWRKLWSQTYQHSEVSYGNLTLHFWCGSLIPACLVPFCFLSRKWHWTKNRALLFPCLFFFYKLHYNDVIALLYSL